MNPKITLGLLLAAVLPFGCGRNDTMASKSAAAYREAQSKGAPVGGGHDHGHGATAATGSTATMDHSTHGTTSDPHAGHDITAGGAAGHTAHGAAADPHAGHSMASTSTADHAAHGTTARAPHAAAGHDAHRGATGADHSQHGGASRGTSGGHATHGTARAGAKQDPHTAMQHGTPATPADPHAQHRAAPSSDPHAQHRAAPSSDPHAAHGQRPATMAVPPEEARVPATNAEMAQTRPATTLRPDAFDAPAPAAVAEAGKAGAGSGGHQDHGAPRGERQTVYTCPMHPEVTSAAPGQCPKCGMTLVKKEK